MRARIEIQAAFEARSLRVLPVAWVKSFQSRFESRQKSHGLRAANLWLLEATEAAEAIRIPIDSTDEDIRALAVKCAAEVLSLAAVCVGVEMLRKRAGKYCARWGVEPPEAEYITKSGKRAGVADRPAIARMTDPLWWRGKLRKIHGRNLEAEAIRMGYVHRYSQVYASNVTVERRRQQIARNAAVMAETVARNLDTGEEFKLAELVARGVSDKRIRRGELMVRMKGCEEIAQGLGHVGLFFTVTCPSRMHKKRTAGKRVFDNGKYDGTTPREAQGYLSGMWAKCRAALGRAGILPYGFRIAEPHHDATPHWHLLLFVAADLAKRFCSIFAQYARAEDAHEMDSKEARRARFDVKFIDWKRGTATGYIAKYVAKNIDGYQVQGDFEGNELDAVTGSQRVEAWASTWGIRQFQPIGQAPVTVWRELRRIEQGETETIEAARAAADVGNWRRYMEVQGGPCVRRDDRPLSAAYTRAGERWGFVEGAAYQAPMTRYGEEAAPGVFGVHDKWGNRVQASARYRWEIRRGGPGRLPGAGIGANGESSHPGPCRVVSGSAQPAPWSPVNNCTEGEKGGSVERSEAASRDGREAGKCAAGHVPGAGGGSPGAGFPGHRGFGGRSSGTSGG